MDLAKKFKFHIIAILAIVVCGISYSVFGFDINKENIFFLNGYGWEVQSPYTDKADIIVSSPFDMVYENYNLLQKDAGLDLRPYCGKSGIRYTYVVTNYPIKTDEIVYANVIVIEGKCVAGDIMTVPIDGFIHSLSFNPEKDTN